MKYLIIKANKIKQAMMRQQLRHFAIVLLLLSGQIFSQDPEKLISYFTPQFKQSFEKTYGTKASRTFSQWIDLIQENDDKDDWQKIRLVNHFFNKK
ncbi:hypothetical protein ACLKMH_14385 [Psychromonas sp. KJ10-10]